MSYRYEKSSGDIVIEGFEKGIAASPHLGIANMQCVDLNTEPMEASLTYERVQETQSAIASGTFNALDSTHITYVGSPPLLLGSWITVTASTISGLSTGTYFVVNQASVVFQLSTTNSSSNTISGLGTSGTATFNTTSTAFGKIVAGTTAVVGLGATVYFMMDVNGVVLYRNPNFTTWEQLSPTGPSNGAATGLQAFNGYLFRFYTDSTTFLPTIDYTTINSIVGGSAVVFTVLGNIINTTIHQTLSGHDNTMYYTDGNYVGSIAPAFSPVTANYTVGHVTSATVFTATILQGTNFVNDMPINVSSSGSNPGGISPNFTYYIANVGTINPSVAGVYTLSGTVSAGATSASLSTNWIYASTTGNTGIAVKFSDGETRIVTFTNGSTSISWTTGLSNNVSALITIPGPTQTFSLSTTPSSGGTNLVSATSDGTGILTIASIYFNPAVSASYVWNKYALQLPTFEISQCLAELGTNLMVGGSTNNIYPWDRSSTTATTSTTSSFFYPLLLPENNTVQMVTVNNMLFCFSGNKGNIYITNGSSASLALSVPDYVTGQNEPVFTWGGTMYLRGRVWFSVQAPNSGGVWSFTPTLNQLSLGQDVGVQLHLENQNSNATYNGMATVLLPAAIQTVRGPQYWAGIWDGSTAYAIDNSGSGPANSPGLIESDAIPTGTFLAKSSYKQVEYKLSTALVAGESVQLYYRQDLGFNSNGTWLTLGSVIVEPNDPLSGYFVANFQNTQWLQIRAIITGTDTNPTFNRLKEIRIR